MAVRLRTRKSDAERAKEQREIVEKVRARLASEDLDEDLIVSAYKKKGGARALAEERAVEHENRVDDLRSLAKAEAKAHARLHTVLGQPKRVGPRQRGPGAKLVTWGRWTSPPCDLVTCDSPFPEVQGHAEFCRWLDDQAERVATHKLPPLILPTLPGERLDEKGPILLLLRDVLGLERREIALFLLVRSLNGTFPITDDDIVKMEKAMHNALAAWLAKVGIRVPRASSSSPIAKRGTVKAPGRARSRSS